MPTCRGLWRDAGGLSHIFEQSQHRSLAAHIYHKSNRNQPAPPNNQQNGSSSSAPWSALKVPTKYGMSIDYRNRPTMHLQPFNQRMFLCISRCHLLNATCCTRCITSVVTTALLHVADATKNQLSRLCKTLLRGQFDNHDDHASACRLHAMPCAHVALVHYSR
jgi:hypothetical protein